MSIVLFILASILLAFPAAAQSAPVNLQFALNWKAEPEFGGFYAAKLSGYFEKREINVDITEGGAGTPVVQMVANGKVPFGIAAGDEVAIAQARDRRDTGIGRMLIVEEMTSAGEVRAERSAEH